MNLHQQIEKNKRKSFWIILLFLLIYAMLGLAVGVLVFDDPLIGLLVTLVVALVYLIVMIRSGTNAILYINGARRVPDTPEFQHLLNTVDSLAIAARVPVPKTYIIDDPAPNAFASGMNPHNAAVAVTTGLLETLNREELEAVLAHEIAHIKNFDVRLATTLVALIGSIALLAHLVRNSLYFGVNDNRSNRNDSNGVLQLIALLFVLLAPFFATLVQLMSSRNREFLADASAAELTRNPTALASALKKVTASTRDLDRAPDVCRSMYFVAPLREMRRNRRAKNLWSTHPPTEERIRALEIMVYSRQTNENLFLNKIIR